MLQSIFHLKKKKKKKTAWPTKNFNATLSFSNNLLEDVYNIFQTSVDNLRQNYSKLGGFLKALMPITFSSPRAQPEVVYFLIPKESPYFSDCKSKISASNSL